VVLETVRWPRTADAIVDARGEELAAEVPAVGTEEAAVVTGASAGLVAAVGAVAVVVVHLGQQEVGLRPILARERLASVQRRI
jgi:hypothetical protein